MSKYYLIWEDDMYSTYDIWERQGYDYRLVMVCTSEDEAQKEVKALRGGKI